MKIQGILCAIFLRISAKKRKMRINSTGNEAGVNMPGSETSEAKTFSREKVARQSRAGCGAVPGCCFEPLYLGPFNQGIVPYGHFTTPVCSLARNDRSSPPHRICSPLIHIQPFYYKTHVMQCSKTKAQPTGWAKLELLARFELATSSLPRMRSTD